MPLKRLQICAKRLKNNYKGGFMATIKIETSILRRGDLIKLKDDPGAPWWYVKDIKDGVFTLEENTMFYLNEKKLKINPRCKRYVFCEVQV